jgi:hypothetical protein
VQLKAVLRVSPGILCAPNVLAVIILARNNQNYPSVVPMSHLKVVSGVTELWNSDSPPYEDICLMFFVNIQEEVTFINKNKV